jgi:AraC-like DNA-binding protein
MLFHHRDISYFTEDFPLGDSNVQLPVKLLSCGHVSASPVYLCDGRHPEILASAIWQYTLAGGGTLDYEGAPAVSLGPGSLLLLTSPHDYFYYRAKTEETWVFLFVRMIGKVAIRLCQELIAKHGPVNHLPIQSSALATAEEILASVCERKISNDWIASAMAYNLIMNTGKDLESGSSGNDIPGFIQRAMDYCVLHSNHSLKVGELAKVAGYSHYHFVRLFKAHVGIAPSDYIREVKLSKARRLLQVADPSVKEVATSCGFVSASHFSRAFCKRFGVNPCDVSHKGKKGEKSGFEQAKLASRLGSPR